MCSAARLQPKGAQLRGFTLIEMLVVLAIIGLCLSLVTAIARPDERALVQLEAERLAQLLDLAATESRLTGKSISWTSDGAGYRFRRYAGDREWTELRESEVLRARSLPAAVSLSNLRLENMSQRGMMQLDFTPYAPALSFSIDVSALGERYAVTGSATGEVYVERKSGPADVQTAH